MENLRRGERIKDINGYEGLYAVSTFGRVWSYRRNRWLKSWQDNRGYMHITLSVKGSELDLRLHRLVAETFIDNTNNKPQINHKNGIKSDCRVSNLEWCTARENLQHAADMGLNKIFRLKLEEKILISVLYCRLGIKQHHLAEMFDVSQPNICYTVKTNKDLLLPDNYHAAKLQG